MSFEERLHVLQEETYPAKNKPAVVSEMLNGLWIWVQCECGFCFEYLQDRVTCYRCGRFFMPGSAEDKVGIVDYGVQVDKSISQEQARIISNF